MGVGTPGEEMVEATWVVVRVVVVPAVVPEEGERVMVEAVARAEAVRVAQTVVRGPYTAKVVEMVRAAEMVVVAPETAMAAMVEVTVAAVMAAPTVAVEAVVVVRVAAMVEARVVVVSATDSTCTLY